MRFLHISDLHIGKRMYHIDLYEDQAHLLNEICDMAVAHNCDGILLAGDIYDRAQPSAQAIALTDTFFTRLSAQETPVYLISGNHDNPAQVSYCAALLQRAGIFACEQFDGTLQRITVQDEYGPVDICLLPFLRPGHVRRFYPDAEIKSYEDAVRTVLAHAPMAPERRSVLVAHQYIAGAATCESEELSIGGLEQIPAELFASFCYTALGHLHSPQSMLGGKVRYCGSMLKYSFDERNHQKGALLVDLDGEGGIAVQKLPFHPLRDVRSMEGKLSELIQLPYSEDYVEVILTDEEIPLDARGALRINFPNLLHLRVQNSRTNGEAQQAELPELLPEAQSPLEHFTAFYSAQNNGVAPDEEKLARMRRALQEVEEGQA